MYHIYNMAEISSIGNLTANEQTVLTAITDGTYFVHNATPSGAINGSNVTFTLASAPNPAASLELRLNGQILKSGSSNDFTLSSLTITMNFAPASGDVLTASYVLSPV